MMLNPAAKTQTSGKRSGRSGLATASLMLLIASSVASCGEAVGPSDDSGLWEWDVNTRRTLNYVYKHTVGFDRAAGPETNEVRYALQFLGNGRVRVTEAGVSLGEYQMSRAGLLSPLGGALEAPARLDLLAIMPDSGRPSSWTRSFPSAQEVDADPNNVVVQSRADFTSSSPGPDRHLIGLLGYVRIASNAGGQSFLNAMFGQAPSLFFDWHLSMVGDAAFNNGRLERNELILEVPPTAQHTSPAPIRASPWRSVVEIQVES